MLAESPYFQRYLFTALEAQPALFVKALEGLSMEEADLRPDPDRFTIREALAHVADWEDVFLERMRRICEEDHPTLPGYDESAWAIEHNYAETDPFEQLDRFRSGRERIVSFLMERPKSDWKRTGERTGIGVITLESMAVIVTLHDTYHLKQLTEWRQAS